MVGAFLFAPMQINSVEGAHGTEAATTNGFAGGFVKQSRDRAVDELLRYPNDFALLTQIARRARWNTKGINLHGLALGEALIGDFRSLGMTERAYRTAKKRLEKAGLATFRATSRGTIATLAGKQVYDINLAACDGQNDRQTTSKRRTDDEQSDRQTTNNEEEKLVNKGKSNEQLSSPKAVSVDFDVAVIEGVYQAYPRKIGKSDALKAIAKVLAVLAKRPNSSDPAAWLLERVQTYAASPAGRQGKYTPYPTTWFSSGRYDDDPAEWQRHTASNHSVKMNTAIERF